MNVEDFIKPNKSNTKQEVSTVKSDNQIKEEALAWKEYEEQQKQNEREVTPEEKEATERWLNGEEIEPQRNDETIVIEFSAKERKYKVINEDRDSKEDFEMTIDEIINSKEFSDFKEDILFNRDENLENMDTYLSFILNKSDNKWNTNKLENYINALNKKEAISAKTDIYYNMNGIYSKEYDEVSSNFFMDTANKHSNLGIADVEKNTWTKFLEKHDKIRKGIFNARKIANRVKNLVSKNKSLNGEPQKVIAESKYTDDQRALKEAREKREKYNEYLANKENNMQSEGKQVIHGSRAYRESIKASDEVINNIKKMQEEKKNNPKTKEELIAENKAKENEPLEGEGLSFEDWTK